MSVFDMIAQGAKIAGGYISENAPTILTVLGIGGMTTAVVMATKEPTKVEEELYELEREEKDADVEKHAIMPRVKIYAKHYWPTALVVITSAGCLIFANSINLKRNAALLAACQLSTMNVKDLKEKIVQLDGDKKLRQYEESIAHDKLATNPPPSMVGGGQKDRYWIYDVAADRYMWGNKTMVDRAFMRIKDRLYSQESYIDLNDLYDEMTEAGLVCENRVGVPRLAMGYKQGYDDICDFQEPRISFHGWDDSNDGCPVMVLQYDFKTLSC